MDRMHAAWHSLLIGLPILLVHLALTTVLLLVGLGIYVKLAPVCEIALLREGNLAVATVFSGQMLALAIPLSAMLVTSVNAPDIVLWGIVAVILQFIAISCLRMLWPGMPERIARGEVAPAVVYACSQVVIGLLTAAAIAG